jgi:hypothetical protein
MPDDPGVLGNLPRSRPGRRSDKRGGRKPASAGSAQAKPKAKRPAAKAGGASGRRAAPARARQPRRPTQPEARGVDPVTEAIRLAGQAAALPFKVAGEVIKRLPRR